MNRQTTYGLRYLCAQDVRQACEEIDSIEIMRKVFTLHGAGQTVLPDEAYLAWNNPLDEQVRSLNMPGFVGGDLRAVGTKVINSCIANPSRAIPRASGLTLLFDETSARPICIMEGAFLSSLRTASVTLLAAELLAYKHLREVAIIGAGVLAQAHIKLLLRWHSLFPDLCRIRIFDIKASNAATLVQEILADGISRGIDIQVAESAEEAISAAQLVIPVTTTTAGYIPFAWLLPGTLLVNVSLDDPLPEVALLADRVIVDDWNLVKNDHRRLLGRMYRSQQILPPDSPQGEARGEYRSIDAQLSEVLTKTKKGRINQDDIILFNPFGLAIEDIALAASVYQLAIKHNLGIMLEP